MATASWQFSGDYFATCSCDLLCPCLPSNLAAQLTKGSCDFAMVFHIDQGRDGSLTFDGLNFAVVGHTPTAMSQGNWSVGVILDDRHAPGTGPGDAEPPACVRARLGRCQRQE
jgi:hypothetical protein